MGRKLEVVAFFKCFGETEKVTPIDYDRVETLSQSLERKQKMASQTDLRQEPDVQNEVTWQMISMIQDRLCLYIYSVVLIIVIAVFMSALYGHV